MNPLTLGCDGMGMLELAVCIFIIGAVLAAIIPNSHTLIEHQQFRRDFVDLRSALETAKLRALQRQQDISLNINHGEFSVCLDHNQSCERHNTKFLLTLNKNERGVLRFSSNGVASPATLRLNSANQSCQLTISLRERILEKCTTK